MTRPNTARRAVEATARTTLLLAALAAPALAPAGIVPADVRFGDDGSALWSYRLSFDSARDELVGNAGAAPTVDTRSVDAVFTLVGFAGYVEGSCAGPFGWRCVVQRTPPADADGRTIDGDEIVTLSWLHVGGPDAPTPGPGWTQDGFVAQSIHRGNGPLAFAAWARTDAPATTRWTAASAGTVRGPAGVTIPEPGSLALAGLALAALVLSGRHARQRTRTIRR